MKIADVEVIELRVPDWSGYVLRVIRQLSGPRPH